MTKWISIKDRLPETVKSVLTLDNYKKIESIGICKRDKDGIPLPMPWYTMHDNILHNYSVTHWQPLPEPPEEL